MTALSLTQPPAAMRVPSWLSSLLVVVAALAVMTPLLIVGSADRVRPSQTRRTAAAPANVVPPAELPPVEPVRFQNLTPDDARAWNAGVPLVAGPNPAAQPYRFAGDEADRARAVDCLAAAALYEAGDDRTGERAVAQVVLNRLRHPAFPKTVCGVVFQGADRATGCQFTFTCDGALVRHTWSAAAWDRARQVANASLSGAVYAPVGYATHYHTDWVVPYWSASLDKIAAVGSHLFFRWTGWWGTPPAFRRHPDSREPVVTSLARYSPAHGSGAAGALGAEDTPGTRLTTYASVPGDPDSFLITLPANIAPGLLPAFAQALCGDRARCKVMGWTDEAHTPRALPLPTTAIATMAFSYLHDESAEFDRPLWNCRTFPRPANQCMKRQMIASGEPAPQSIPRDRVAPVSFTLLPVGDALAGVHRKGERAPAPASPEQAAQGTPQSLLPPSAH